MVKSHLIAIEYNKNVDIIRFEFLYDFMNIQTINFKTSTNKTFRLTSIFSIFFVTLFLVATALTDEKENTNAKTFSSLPIEASDMPVTTMNGIEPQVVSIQTTHDSQQPGIAKQTGTGSSISNYVNAWKLSKVTPASQIFT
ncbi:MAG TPA: hypothetical protein VFG45_06805 [Candidatus Nitrosocosmicus sp.]|nr:hypothetical protein [Candidatus Nitrosocosmicus sp.]